MGTPDRSRQGAEKREVGTAARAESEIGVRDDFRVVGIGASAGGLIAIGQLLHELPRDFDMAIVVLMHLDPDHESSLAELLAKGCALPVEQVTEDTPLEAGRVYVIPPNKYLSVEGRSLIVSPRVDSPEPQRPIDMFFRSIAEEYDGRCIGVVLSGTGSDGTAGLAAIKGRGGITFVQDDSATHADMPKNAAAAVAVDAVASPAAIARELTRIAAHPLGWLRRDPATRAIKNARDARPAKSAAGDPDHKDRNELAVDLLVRKLARSSGIDFCNYKQTTVRRRIERRMVLLRLDSIEAYAGYIEAHPEEAATLCDEILIHVTSFFRDPEVFDALRDTIYPTWIANRSPDEPIRIWVAGCATGEEVYSLAIHLLEFLEQHSLSFPIRVFGTDVSESVVANARAGRFDGRIASEVSPERLRRYFVRSGNGYVISKAVREVCVFARQDATRDPPFSNLDLISCRNLLIYLNPTLQQRVLTMFHYALRDGGTLVLGTAEKVGALEHLFAAADARNSIYLRRSVPRRLSLGVTAIEPRYARGETDLPLGRRAVSGLDAQREADRILLAKYAPTGVVIDEELQVLQFRGDTGAFLVPAPGVPSNNLLKMAREGVLTGLSEVIAEGKSSNASARRDGLRIKAGADGREIVASIELTPIRVPDSAERCFLILFEETNGETGPVRAAKPPASKVAATPDAVRIAQLERELVTSREYLHANVERLEAANEELRAANEEVLSSNEELQSTNEELQTAKEGLQVTNEELVTVDQERQHRTREVTQLSDDLSNLFSSVKIPIVMVGQDLRIRRFTPSAAAIHGLTASDLGRGVLDAEAMVGRAELEGMIHEVLATLGAREREVQDDKGRWYSLGVQPYRTQDNRVDGAVISMFDIDATKRAAKNLEIARDYAQSIVMSMRDPLLVLDPELVVRLANRAYCETLGESAEAIVGKRLGSRQNERWITPEIRNSIAAVADGGPPLENVAVLAETAARGTLSLRISARSVPGEGERQTLVLVTIEDVTQIERHRAEKERLTRKLQETQRLESLGVLAGGIAHDFNNILTAILGFTELIEMLRPDDEPLRTYVEKIRLSSRRAADLCDQMLAYSGKGRFRVKRADLSALVRDSAPLLEAMVSKKSHVRYELAAGLPAIDVDVTQLRQVLTNMVLNASEALAAGGGSIVVRTGVMHASAEYLKDAQVGGVPEGRYVFLEICDDGIGMTPETQSRIFDPFFTTKFAGRGLGLAAVLGIVRGHHGALRLDSEPGKGSTFRFLLPVKGEPVTSLTAPSAAAGATRAGEGTVLVVDDEPDVRAVLRGILEQLGFQVEEASNGKEGLERLFAHLDEIDLVLLDLTMPELGGVDTFHAMRKLRPDLDIVLMSGYDEEESMRSLPRDDLAGFLRKPFVMSELTENLEHLFADRGGDPPPS
jgi:two-component system CheB/CheR fusion protein